ncbi:DoxX family protein [Arthrobacter sp. ISL-28]|uniref:DoxX family protein n=1 Tax=Arthrobacter sp. ISL-28 TaxID=2819108 RepID=UPI001BECD65C|nr:DoxX family protein [Arthrobacter sp. ISL-28]MBT2523095.1 DoxX family protein [Arthrobacter sp. ISL-28]
MTSVDIALLVLRLSIGITMAIHGYAKLFLGGRIAGTSKWFTSLGMRPATFHAWLAAITEIAAGLALAAGLLTPFASAAFVALMLVAAWTVHRKKGFLITSGGWEYTFILAVAAISIAIMGPGHLSLDWLIFGAPHLEGLPGLFISIGVGGVAGAGLLTACYRPPKNIPA